MKNLPVIFIIFVSGVFSVTSVSAQIQKEEKPSSVPLQDAKKLLSPKTAEQSESVSLEDIKKLLSPKTAEQSESIPREDIKKLLLPETAEQSEQEEAELLLKKEIIANDLIKKAFKETDYNEKIRLYKKALELAPDNPDAYNNLGIIYKKIKMYNLAIDSYKKALNIPGYRTPEHAHNNLGVVYKEMERYDEAIEEFKKGVAIKPSFAKAWNNLGMVYKKKGMFDKATECFEKAVKLEPGYTQAAENLKNVWKLPKEKSPQRKKIESIYSKAQVLFHKGKIKEAIAGFQQVEKLDPDFGQVQAYLEQAQIAHSFYIYIDRAGQLARQGKFDSARQKLQQTAKYANSEGLKEKLAQKIAELNQMEEANAKKSQLESLYDGGIIQLQQKQWLKAISLFTKIILVDENYKDVQEYNRQARIGFYLTTATEKTKQKQWDDAQKAYQALLKIDPQNEEGNRGLQQLSEQKNKDLIESHLLQAEDALNFQDNQAAKWNFEQVLKIDPENQTALEGLEKITAKKPIKRSSKKLPLDKTKLAKSGGIAAFALLILVILIRTLQPRKIVDHYRKLKDFDKTRIIYERVLDNEPQRRNFYGPLASLYYQLKLQKKLPGLLDYCHHQLKEASPSDAPLWQLCLGEIYLESKELDKAREEMEKAYEMAPEQGEIARKLIETYNLLLKEDPENSTWQERVKQLNQAQQLPLVQKSPGQSLENMDEEAKRSLLKECFGQKKDHNESQEKSTKAAEPKLHPAAS